MSTEPPPPRRSAAVWENSCLIPIAIGVVTLALFHLVVALAAPAYWFQRASWDEVYYLGIAREGYLLRDGDYGKFSEVAFSPGWPLLMRTLWKLTGVPPLALRLPLAGLLSILGCVGFAWALRALSADVRRNHWVLAVFATWPGSMFFRTGYSEALYFPLLTFFFGFLLRRRYLAAAIFAGLAWFTRTPAIVLAGTLAAAIVIDGLREGPLRAALLRIGVRLAWAMPIAAAGLAGYMVMLWWQVGDPGAFLKAYSAWSPVEVDEARNLSMKSLADVWFAAEQPTVAWSVVTFLAIPFVVIPRRASLPLVLVLFTLGAWLFFLSADWVKYPFHDMTRWTAVLFPVHLCLVDIALGWSVRVRRLVAVLWFGVTLAAYVWFTARFASGLYVS